MAVADQILSERTRQAIAKRSYLIISHQCLSPKPLPELFLLASVSIWGSRATLEERGGDPTFCLSRLGFPPEFPLYSWPNWSVVIRDATSLTYIPLGYFQV